MSRLVSTVDYTLKIHITFFRLPGGEVRYLQDMWTCGTLPEENRSNMVLQML